MDVNSCRGRGRGRGAIVSEFIEDLRRPNTIPPGLTMSDVNQVSPIVPPFINPQIQPQGDIRTLPYVLNTNVEEQVLIERLKQVDLMREAAERTEVNQTMVDTKKSILSADAPEFIPRCPPQPQEHISIDPQATAFIPHMIHPQHGQFQNNQMMPEPQMELFNHPTVVKVNNLVVELSVSPDRYHIITRKVCDLLNNNGDPNIMKEVVTVIFEQGQGEPNFRYHGAKLCADLSRNVERTFNNRGFKAMLLDRLNEEFKVKDLLLFHQAERFRGYLMFLAEIFTQVTTPENHPLVPLGDAICDLLKLLMNNAYCNDVNMSCITKVLKFTGSLLDQVTPNRMEAVMNCVRQMAVQKTGINERTKNQLVAIIELRAGNWGKDPPSPTGDSEPGKNNKSANVAVFETVYYGPNGVIKKVDEKCDETASDTDDYVLSSELDGEAAAAFEEFLKMQQNE